MTKNKLNDTFANLPIFNNEGKEIEYTIKEDRENNGKVIIGTDRYKVSYKVDKNTVTITNEYLPPQLPLNPANTSITVKKEWADPSHKEDSIEVELYKNGQATGDKKILNDVNNWSNTFESLPILEVSGEKKNIYTIKEVGEDNGQIIVGNNKYTVTYEKKIIK